MTGLVYRWFDSFLSRPQRPGSVKSYLYELAHLEIAILGLYLLRGSVLVVSFGYTVGVGSTLIAIAYGDEFLRGIALGALPARKARDSADAPSVPHTP